MSAGEAQLRGTAAAKNAVDREIIRTSLLAYADELGTMLGITAPTTDVSQGREFTVVIADAMGAVSATDNPLQVASMAQTIGHVVRHFEFDLSEGDVIATSDPYEGGSRINDITLIAPLMVDDELILFLAARVRVGDVGGQISGSINPGATDILAEGHPLPAVKIYRHGRVVRDMLYAFLLNGRLAEETRRTLDAGVAALQLGQRRLNDLIGRFGVEQSKAALTYAQDYSERITRRAIETWRDGTYERQHVMPLPPALGGPATLRVSATVSSDTLSLDFTGSDDQRPIFVNSAAGVTASRAVGAVLAMLGEHVPANSGVLRAVEVRTRPGSIVHPTRPMPVGWGAETGCFVTELVTNALGAAATVDVAALTMSKPLILARPQNDRSRQLDLGRWGMGGASAVAGADGWGLPPQSTRAQLPSVELWEGETAVRIKHMEMVQDSAGTGQWCGAPGVEVVMELPPDYIYTVWSASVDGCTTGRADGKDGLRGDLSFHCGDEWVAAPATASEMSIDADQLRLRLGGGSGRGTSADRDRQSVIGDVLDGFISETKACEDYGFTTEGIAAATLNLPFPSEPKKG